MLPRFDQIIDKVREYNPGTNVPLLQVAYLFSAFAHEGQERHSGEPYLIHPISVAEILADLKADDTALVAGLLHDVVEDNLAVNLDDVASRFGEEVAHIVESVTKIEARMVRSTSETMEWHNIRRMILAMVDDIRVILVKLADRLHNLRTMEHVQVDKRPPKALETLELYAPIAYRLGLGKMKTELEDLGFRYAYPEEYEKIDQAITGKRFVSDNFLENIRAHIEKMLREMDVEGAVQGRTKHFFSIYQKLVTQGIDIERVYDYLAFRVIVPTVKDCYQVMGGIHSIWKPIPGRFKDFIAIPKENHYRSLHTSVIGPEGNPFEIQIRTFQMHQEAENGISAHWRYKEGRLRREDENATMEWMRHLLDWNQEAGTSTEFVHNLKMDLYPKEVYVFTPQGKVLSFPRGSTPLDFAFAIHSEVGFKCTGARINNKLVPLKTCLRSGDRVDIITSPSGHPSRDWLGSTVTSRAQRKIRSWLNAKEKSRAMELGRSNLDRELKRLHINIKDAQESGELQKAFRKVSLPDLDSLHAEIGYGKISARIFVKKLLPEVLEDPVMMPEIPVKPSDGAPVIVHGTSDLLTGLAKCCKPIIGDDAIGFITRARGLIVHRRKCRNLVQISADPHRMIEVEWAPNAGTTANQEVRVVIQAEDRDDIYTNITQVISDSKARLRKIEGSADSHEEATLRVLLGVKNLTHLNQVIGQIKKVSGVIGAARGW